MATTPPKPRARARTPEAEIKALHADLRAAVMVCAEAASAMNHLASTLQPLADRAPDIIEMVSAWNTTKAGVGALGRVGHFATGFVKSLGKFVRWVGGVAIGVAAIWAVTHAQWLALLGGKK